MDEPQPKIFDKKSFLITLLSCLAASIVTAFIVSRETSGYVAGFTFLAVLIFTICPIFVILLISSIVSVYFSKPKLALMLLLSSFVIPIIFGVSVKLMEITKISLYARDGVDDMRLFGSQLNERIIVAFKKDAQWNDIVEFDEKVFRKTTQKTNGVFIGFADGVCGIMYPDTEFDSKIADIGFCNDATIEQKEKIKSSVTSSKLVLKMFENLKMEDIPNLPLEKRKPNLDEENTSPKKIAVDSK